MKVHVVQPRVVHNALKQTHGRGNTSVNLCDVHNKSGDGGAAASGACGKPDSRSADCVYNSRIARIGGIGARPVDVGLKQITSQIPDGYVSKDYVLTGSVVGDGEGRRWDHTGIDSGQIVHLRHRVVRPTE